MTLPLNKPYFVFLKWLRLEGPLEFVKLMHGIKMNSF